MSDEQLASSVAGDPSVQPPPTPKQTPALSSPLVLETPQIPSDSHDDPRDPFGESSGWTPRFAEEYSVFNATPGNLRADANRHYHHHHHHHSSSVESSSALWSPFPPPSSAGHKRLHSSGEISLPADPLGAYSSNNNNNSNNNVSPTSPAIPAWPTPESATDLQDERKKAPKRLSPKKKRPRCDTRVRGTQRPPEQYDNHNHNHNSNNDDDEATQTATPPPSAQKEKRKRSLAPRLDTNAMQSDHGFGHVDFGTSSHQQHQQQPDDMPAFLSTPSDLFGYPLSAPAGPAASFWDPDPSCMAGMDIDFGAGGGGGGGGAEVFQNGSVHGQRPMDPVDWSAGPMSFLQPDGALQQHNQENIQPSRGPQEMEPKNLAPADGNTSSSADAGVFVPDYPPPMTDAFGIVGNNTDGVDPGLLFSRPPSSGLTSTAMGNDMNQTNDPPPTSSAPAAPPPPAAAMARATAALRRSLSVKELGPSQRAGGGRSKINSPTKSGVAASRPGLSRSYSENRGKRGAAAAAAAGNNRASLLPTLAPAASRPSVAEAANSRSSFGISGTTTAQQPNRPGGGGSGGGGGRISPLKNSHQRLSSLSSIPEVHQAAPRARAHATFSIDPSGRARVETTVIVDEQRPSAAMAAAGMPKRYSALPRLQHRSWTSSDEDDSVSSDDDDPIIIPSRNASFALPDPVKPTRPHPFRHSSQRSSTSSYVVPRERRDLRIEDGFLGGGAGGSDPESEAETVLDESTPTAAAAAAGGKQYSGDAASELRKLRDGRQPPWSNGPLAAAGSTMTTTKQRRFVAGLGVVTGGGAASAMAGFATATGGYGRQDTVSPTAYRQTTSLPTPSTGSRGHGVRCICDRAEIERDGDYGMVQCDSCEMLLHSRCVNLSKTTLPSIYICAFCANTPNARTARSRNHSRLFGEVGPPLPSTSPLAHKSFKFR